MAACATPASTLHFTPTYSSWLNLVERWFAELTTKKLRRSTHRSVAELDRAIRAWVDTWNDDPRPFVWPKTADEILDNLAGYLPSNHQLRTLALARPSRIGGRHHEHPDPSSDS